MDDSNKKYIYGGLALILLLWWRKSSAKKKELPAPQAPMIEAKKVNVLDNLPNPNNLNPLYSSSGQKLVREVFRGDGGVFEFDASHSSPVIGGSVTLPDPNTVYGIRMAIAPVPASGFLERIEDLQHSIGIAAGGMDAGLAIGGKTHTFAAPIDMLLGMTDKSPSGKYVIAVTVVPEQKKVDGKIESFQRTQDELNAIPRSYAIVTIPQGLA